eukprot:scaffold160595_cov21-Tisochrysis_lutea.AAC.1
MTAAVLCRLLLRAQWLLCPLSLSASYNSSLASLEGLLQCLDFSVPRPSSQGSDSGPPQPCWMHIETFCGILFQTLLPGA